MIRILLIFTSIFAIVYGLWAGGLVVLTELFEHVPGAFGPNISSRREILILGLPIIGTITLFLCFLMAPRQEKVTMPASTEAYRLLKEAREYAWRLDSPYISSLHLLGATKILCQPALVEKLRECGLNYSEVEEEIKRPTVVKPIWENDEWVEPSFLETLWGAESKDQKEIQLNDLIKSLLHRTSGPAGEFLAKKSIDVTRLDAVLQEATRLPA